MDKQELLDKIKLALLQVYNEGIKFGKGWVIKDHESIKTYEEICDLIYENN